MSHGKRWNDIEHSKVHEDFGGEAPFIFAIKSWIEREHDAGRPSELKDFYMAHRICFDCQALGVRIVEWEQGPDGDRPLLDSCQKCMGTGRT